VILGVYACIFVFGASWLSDIRREDTLEQWLFNGLLSCIGATVAAGLFFGMFTQ